MNWKQIFKTTEGIAVLSCFAAIVLTGYKIFAYAGIISYIIINIEGGIEAASKIINFIVQKIKNLIKK